MKEFLVCLAFYLLIAANALAIFVIRELPPEETGRSRTRRSTARS